MGGIDVDQKPHEQEQDKRKRRRSRRIRARIRIVVRAQTRDRQTVSEETDALVVNAHGGLVLLAAHVTKNQFITIVNQKTREELLGRVTDIGERFMGKAQVGIEFIRPVPEFWGVSPRPKDWNLASFIEGQSVPEKV